jgi:hypothetical protein
MAGIKELGILSIVLSGIEKSSTNKRNVDSIPINKALSAFFSSFRFRKFLLINIPAATGPPKKVAMDMDLNE